MLYIGIEIYMPCCSRMPPTIDYELYERKMKEKYKRDGHKVGKVTESQSPLKLPSRPLATNHLVSSLFLRFGQFYISK